MVKGARDELARITNEQYEMEPFYPQYYREMLPEATVADQEKPMTEAEKVVGQMLAYYKTAEPVFIRNVIYQVAERHLLLSMATMFDPIEVLKMDPRQSPTLLPRARKPRRSARLSAR